jgi:hypothetical protein
MDRLDAFMEDVRKLEHRSGQFRGLLHLLIGRRIAAADGSPISAGLTWRETAALLRRIRWPKDAVIELGQESKNLPPRDREKYWYSAILHAQLDGDEAQQAGDALAQKLSKLGYRIAMPSKGTG